MRNMLGLMAAGAALALSGLGMACAQAPGGEARFNPAARRAAVEELAGLMERNYVFPEQARRYAEHLRTQSAAGRYDANVSPADFAANLQRDLRGVHEDAHLRVAPVQGGGPGSAMRRISSAGDDAFGPMMWLAHGVAYLPITLLPGDEASVQRMAAMLDEYRGARALVIDARLCMGGTLAVMDVLFSRLYPERTHLLTMDMRAGANPELDAAFDALPSMEHVDAPAGITRWRHWVTPDAAQGAWANARVFVLTDVTASACEHMSLALKRTQRATLVGAVTRGAGHFGGDRGFGGGRFEVFLPVGRTYDPVTNWDWEGAGIAPDVAVAPDAALDYVARELSVAFAATPPRPVMRGPTIRQEVAPSGRRYGIAMIPPRGGESFITIQEVVAGAVAASAGVRAGDRIVSLNGTPVSQIPPADLPTFMRGSPLVVVVERGGETIQFDLSLDP